MTRNCPSLSLRRAGAVVLTLLVLSGLGCQLRRGAVGSSDELARQNAQLQRDLGAQRQRAADLEQQLAVCRGFGPGRLAQLVHVQQIEFGRFTRAFDANEDGQADGLRVYLVPRDPQGDVIKAGGTVTIELWDLAAAESARRLGQWRYGPDQLPRHWLSGPFTNHFKFELPWPDGKVPEHANLTLKLTYEDALTGRVWEIQKQVSTRLESGD